MWLQDIHNTLLVTAACQTVAFGASFDASIFSQLIQGLQAFWQSGASATVSAALGSRFVFCVS